MTAVIVLLYLSYAIPVICLLVKGRDNIPHGPFWLGPFGLFSNGVLLAWTLFSLVMYSLPAVLPVSAGSKSFHPFSSLVLSHKANRSLPDMNYVSAVYGILLLIITSDWFIRGKHHYRGQSVRHEEVAHFRGSPELRRHLEADNIAPDRLIGDHVEKI